MSRVMTNLSSGFPTRSDTNWAVQPQNMARGLKFQIKEVEGLFYLCSENKGADQLHSYREADLRLCFRICKMLVFSWRDSNVVWQPTKYPFKIKRQLNRKWSYFSTLYGMMLLQQLKGEIHVILCFKVSISSG